MKYREFWRDLETLGSFTFYAAVIIRSLVGLGYGFFVSLVAALALSQTILLIARSTKPNKISTHASNGGALLVLISAYYHRTTFTLFAIALFGLVCYGHRQLRKHSWAEIGIGFAIGIASGAFAWWLPRAF
jgi:hypothetical protein